jgi:hypothetical protein
MNNQPTFPQARERYYVEKASGSDWAYVIDRKTGRRCSRFNCHKLYGQLEGFQAAERRAGWMNRQAASA